MGADFRALFEDADRNLVIACGSEPLDPDCRGEPGRTRADDNDVVFHGLAGDLFHRGFLPDCATVFRLL